MANMLRNTVRIHPMQRISSDDGECGAGKMCVMHELCISHESIPSPFLSADLLFPSLSHSVPFENLIFCNQSDFYRIHISHAIRSLSGNNVD